MAISQVVSSSAIPLRSVCFNIIIQTDTSLPLQVFNKFSSYSYACNTVSNGHITSCLFVGHFLEVCLFNTISQADTSLPLQAFNKFSSLLIIFVYL